VVMRSQDTSQRRHQKQHRCFDKRPGKVLRMERRCRRGVWGGQGRL